MSAIDMGITAPCPFCGCRDAPDIDEHPGGDVYAECQDCGAQGPPTRVGCRDDEEEDITTEQLEREALELWNDRGKDESITVEQVLDLAPALEASLAELEAREPAVRAARERLDAAVTSLDESRAKRLKSNLSLLEKRKRPE